MAHLLVEKDIYISLRTIKGHGMTMCLVLLLLNICCSNVAGEPFPSGWEPQLSHLSLKDIFKNVDCIKGPRSGLGRRQQQEQQIRLLLNDLNQDNYIDEEGTVEKRDPPASSYNPESSQLSSAGGGALFRDSNPMPCSCYSGSLTSHRDLGNQYYPRYFSDIRCNESSCGSSMYRCNSLNHTVFVLKRRNVEDMENVMDERLPKPLRSQWRFEGVNITVACVCQKNRYG